MPLAITTPAQNVQQAKAINHQLVSAQACAKYALGIQSGVSKNFVAAKQAWEGVVKAVQHAPLVPVADTP